jgi:hypothetical protein
MEPTPARDLDWMSSLSGNVNFKVSGNTADVSVDVPAPGAGEDDGSNFELWAQDSGGTWSSIATVASRPTSGDRKVALSGSHGFTRSTAASGPPQNRAEVDKYFKVKVSWDKANGTPGSSKSSSDMRTPFNTATSDVSSSITFT